MSLDLARTGISTLHLLHLITHAPTLRELNISSNPSIMDDSRVPLSALPRLVFVHLRETAITMPCLRLLVYALPSKCRFVTLPQGCLNYLNDRNRHYSVSLPAGYAEDPRHVANLPLALLKKNLELHKKCNQGIALSGSKSELVHRLMSILCGRVADGCISKRIGRSNDVN